MNIVSIAIFNSQSLWDDIFIYYLIRFYTLTDFVYIKFLEPLPGIERIDTVKKIMLLDLDVIFNFVSNCGIVGIFVI